MRHLGLVLALSLAACSSESTDPSGSAGSASTLPSVTKSIGPSGGVIEVGGATVTFPAGSLAQDTEITIRATDEAPPAGYVALSKVFECSPSGLSFPTPVTMTMPFQDDGKGATMFWSSEENPAFQPLQSAPEGARLTAGVKHFSKGFVGRAP